jgi:hypothetical protein
MVIAVVFLMLVGPIACNEADRKQRVQTEKLMEEADRQVGMPNIMNFQQKKTMKMVYEETDRENLVAYAYIKSDYHGKLIYIGKCIGYGVPFSAQYTNPMRRTGNSYALPQPDPNGLFMPTSSSATWLLMVDPETNKPRPVYIEPEIVVSPFKLTQGVME